MNLIIGLGNPGGKYKNTRHNAGHLFVGELQKFNLPSNVVVKTTDTFMNESGEPVKKWVDQYKLNISDLYIIHDDLDIPLGSYKIQFDKGPKDHNGLKSIDDKLSSSAYWHVRIGVDNRDSGDRTSGEDYVLQDFKDDERQILDKTIIDLCKKLVTLFKNTK